LTVTADDFIGKYIFDLIEERLERSRSLKVVVEEFHRAIVKFDDLTIRTFFN
jgi:hypothetical protein